MFEERGDANCLLICRGWIGNGIERRYEKDAQNARYIYLGSHYVLRTDYITLFIYSEDQNRFRTKRMKDLQSPSFAQTPQWHSGMIFTF